MSFDRGWMYRRVANGNLTEEFVEGVEIFVHYALSQPRFMNESMIKCPCTKCKNKRWDDPMIVRVHLAKNGFIPKYENWVMHGEPLNPSPTVSVGLPDSVRNRYETMVMDVANAQFSSGRVVEEPPNPAAQLLYDMLKAADRELWPGCKTHTQLSLMARLMNLKSENHLSERCFDQILELIKEIVPDDNLVTDDFYSAKKLLRGMGLPVEKIDCCRNNCMLFWGVDENLDECKFCEAKRYKQTNSEGGNRRRRMVAISQMHYFPLTPRLQRLYASNVTAAEMRWHGTSRDDGVMRHPADSPAWKHFNTTFPDFTAEVRNVRLGLCTDGFQPFNKYGQQYSSWPIIVTPYNLPPWMCMKEQHMFLTVVITGPHNPKEMIDVFLQPLIAELTHLWEVGAQTYDISLKNNFQMRAALLWTISDFPAYSMLSGWSTAGKLACPCCLDDTNSFRLPLSGKQSWFDCHRRFLPADHPFRRNKTAFIKNKQVREGPPEEQTGYQVLAEIERLGIKKVTELTVSETRLRISKRQRSYESGWRKKSIFWDLPYWSSLLIRHNLDVMHIEKNLFDNIFNTVMNVKGKTKDTSKSREELNLLCRRPELQGNNATGKYPKAVYMLDNDDKRIFLKWIEELRFSDGYVSNLGRCVNLSTLQMFGMKSHDCHVMMQRILPIAFKELLPINVWKAITDLCLFFKELTSPNLQVDNLRQMHQNIPVILCKLERIFPPSFFDSMEHLPVHLAYEALLAGPVQYRWMYPFERYLGKLKKTVKNKAKVEGSITNAYLVEEASAFCSYYFEDHIRTRQRNIPRNFVGASSSGIQDHPHMLSVFKNVGRAFGKNSTRFLQKEEYDAAHLYVLNNFLEVTNTYTGLFLDEIKHKFPRITTNQLQIKFDTEFPNWFKSYVGDPNNEIDNIYLRHLSLGPLQRATCYQGFYVNGFKVHTVEYGSRNKTDNSGICVKGSVLGGVEQDYYGRLLEVVILEYPGLPIKKITLFKCQWFDPSPTWTFVDREFKLVSINQTHLYNKYEPFVLASQAIQVYYCTYPSRNVTRRNWLAACKVKARPLVEVSSNEITPMTPLPFQEELFTQVHHTIIDDDPIPIHPDGGLVDIIDDQDEDEDAIHEGILETSSSEANDLDDIE